MNTLDAILDSTSFSSWNISLGFVFPALRGSFGLAICVRLFISTYNGEAYLKHGALGYEVKQSNPKAQHNRFLKNIRQVTNTCFLRVHGLCATIRFRHSRLGEINLSEIDNITLLYANLSKKETLSIQQAATFGILADISLSPPTCCNTKSELSSTNSCMVF
jgi:hypothetical protein